MPGEKIGRGRKEVRRMKREVLKILFLVAFIMALKAGHSLTVQDIREQMLSYKESIESLKADFTMEIKGSGYSNNIQKGVLSYTRSGGTVVEYKEPSPVKMEIRPNGAYYFNGKYQGVMTNSYQMGDLFFEFYFNTYELRIEKEDEEKVVIIGYEKTSDVKKIVKKKVLKMVYDKNLKAFESLRYLGTGKDYPYEVNINYQIVQNIPVIKTMTTMVSAYSISVNSTYTLANVSVVRR